MSFPTLQLTDAGRGIIVSALAGGSIVFTKVGVGNGERPADINAITELVNPVKTIGIGEMSKGDGCANITAVLDNANLAEGYWWREIGIYAKDSNDNEVIYAYAHAGEYADYIPAYSNTSYLRTTMNITVVVGSAENVSAVINEYIGYVTTETYESHTHDTDNPHQVTAEQVGLGNVPNVATNDLTPTFEGSSAIFAPESGETLSVIMGKIRTAILRFISHINASNPHNITLAKIGAASAAHNHSSADITSGTLPISRGGTGGTTAATARAALGCNSIYTTRSYTSAKVTFASNAYVTGSIAINSISGYSPVAVASWQIVNDGDSGSSDKNVDLNNIYISGNTVGYHLVNRSASANHCKLSVVVLYIKNL